MSLSLLILLLLSLTGLWHQQKMLPSSLY
ncbi:MAG: GlyGly-CTERM sorting domain-containing protein [Pedobacter sp.]|nr:MAG: GlyGly-CTERM sorting domain-containing protein [Pedobacter sp.]